MAFVSMVPSQFDFTGTYTIMQGADWYVVVTVSDSNGAPIDFSEYNAAAPVATFLDDTGVSTGVEQPTISWVSGGAGGQIQFYWDNVGTTAATKFSGTYQLEITFDTSPPTLKNRILYGSWAMSPETTV